MMAALERLVQAADDVAAVARREKDSDATMVAVLVTGLAVALRTNIVRREEVIAWTIRVASWTRP